MWWPFKNHHGPPPDPMDWLPTTPPQSPSPYPLNYLPGGWPLEFPPPVFRRPAEPDAFLPKAKRVCRGIGRAGAKSAKVATSIGSGAARLGARAVSHTTKTAARLAARSTIYSVKLTANFAAHSSVSVIRAYNRRNPRQPRAWTASGVPYHRVDGYDSPRFSKLRTENNPIPLARQDWVQTYEGSSAVYEMVDTGRYPHTFKTKLMKDAELARQAEMYRERSIEAKLWRAKYENNPFMDVPFDSPWEEDHTEHGDQLQRELAKAVPKSPPKPIQAHSHDSPASPMSLALEQARKVRYTKERMFSGSGVASRAVARWEAEKRIRSERAAAKTHAKEQSQNSLAINGELNNSKASVPPSTAQTEETPPTGTARSDDDLMDISYDSPRTPDHSQTKRKSVTDTTDISSTCDFSPLETPLAFKRDAHKQISSYPTSTSSLENLPSSSDPSGSQNADQQIVSPTEPELPRRPSTAGSETSSSSTTEFTTTLRLFHIASADDAVGSSSITPKVAQKAPPSRISSSGVAKIPGGWDDDETTVDDYDEEKARYDASHAARRSLRHRKQSKDEETKTEEVRSPVSKKSGTPVKTPRHSKTKGKIIETIQEKQERVRRAAEQFKISALSAEWQDKAQHALEHGTSTLKAGDFARVLPTGGQSAWLNDETINSYLSIVAAHGQNHLGGGKFGTITHHAFNSFFYTNLVTPGKGPQFLQRWAKRARIGGKNLLNMHNVYIPINSSSHWTLCVVSGVDRTITYYDSLNGSGTAKMAEVMKWVKMELGEDFVESEWRMVKGESGQQANMDDCGVFTVTNARSLMLGHEPKKAFGPALASVQRERIVAELVNGALLPMGS
ncbi:uncharacterized protein HMPREF1541_04831 [Cyphellophora europaea CBS 101466]|uniref:Ubiquitin-like protease family profile domain-containing protein n=1 Tax=Cyphellophora europaea (strain CBS 101466) TaxID=1220924 RepID=W2RY03_CYPE1|nr:uncharacterized protein HMPREF1541_04831 [Cyphellophora europaea CBS 101466]ETN40554.1 hypothetical protein HMPREF1541_04831 [Cyphellophora europaea CBS 101466]